MIAFLLLALADQPSAPWQKYLPSNISWASVTVDNDRFWIKSEDVTREAPREFAVRLHGEHGYNPQAHYKTSLQWIRFRCDGTLQLLSSKTTSAEGKTDSWEGAGAISPIGAGTVYEDIERKFCTPAK
jgi:hypothetical protein